MLEKPADTMEAELVVIGAIERPFGVKGEVKVRSLSDVPDRFRSLDQVVLTSREGKRLETRVTEVRGGGDRYIVAVEALRSPEEAGEFRGGYLYAEREVAAGAQSSIGMISTSRASSSTSIFARVAGRRSFDRCSTGPVAAS